MSVLEERSERIASVDSNGEISTDKEDTITFTYTGNETTAEAVYFTISEEDWEKFQSASYVEFKDIPKLETARAVVNNDGTMGTWEYAYIIVNVEGSGEKHLADMTKGSGQKVTSVNGVYIGRNSLADGDESKNNHPGVTSLMYNFPEAEKIVIGNNFQGTIFAPKADVTDEYTLNKNDWGGANYRGHFSGSLIAKSFDGGTEFSYRTFTGPYSLLGTDTGYTIELSKQIAGSDLTVDGAVIGLFENDDTLISRKTTKDIEGFTISGNQINAQFSFDTPTPESITGSSAQTVSKSYYLKEISAPDSFALSDDEWKFDVKDTYQNISGYDTPLVSKTTIITYAKTNNNKYTYTIDYDYSTAGQVSYTVKLDGGYENTFIVKKTDAGYELQGDYTLADAGSVKKFTKKATSNASTNAFTVDFTYYYNEKTGTIYPEIQFPPATGYSATPAIIEDAPEVWIKKMDAGGNLLDGAELTITDVTNGGSKFDTIKTTSDKTDDNWNKKYSVSATGEGNTVILDHVYKIQETSVPGGYIPAVDRYFKVSSKDYKIYWGASEAALTNSSETRTISIANTKDNGLELVKVDENNPGKYLEAELEIYSSADDKLIETVTTSETGAVKTKITNYEPGEYYIIEKTAPTGYAKVTDKQYFYIDDVNDLHIGKMPIPEVLTILINAADGSTNILGGEKIVNFGSQYEGKKINKIEIDTQWTEWDSHKIQIKPTGDETAYEWDLDSNSSPLVKDVDITLGKDGYMKINFWNSKIGTVKFYLADGGTPDTTEYKITSKNRIITFTNQNTSVTFRKLDDALKLDSTKITPSSYSTLSAREYLAGAGMELTPAAGNTADLSGVTADNADDFKAEAGKLSWTTTDKDTIFYNIPNGKYVLKEVSPVSGYQAIKETIITISDAGIDSDTKNTRQGVNTTGRTIEAIDEIYAITVRKTEPDGEGDTPVAGAKLQLTGKDSDGKEDDVRYGGVVHGRRRWLHDHGSFRRERRLLGRRDQLRQLGEA